MRLDGVFSKRQWECWKVEPFLFTDTTKILLFIRVTPAVKTDSSEQHTETISAHWRRPLHKTVAKTYAQINCLKEKTSERKQQMLPVVYFPTCLVPGLVYVPWTTCIYTELNCLLFECKTFSFFFYSIFVLLSIKMTWTHIPLIYRECQIQYISFFQETVKKKPSLRACCNEAYHEVSMLICRSGVPQSKLASAAAALCPLVVDIANNDWIIGTDNSLYFECHHDSKETCNITFMFNFSLDVQGSSHLLTRTITFIDAKGTTTLAWSKTGPTLPIVIDWSLACMWDFWKWLIILIFSFTTFLWIQMWW